jgi:hypothetical protein
MADLTGQRLEVGDDKLNFPIIHKRTELPDTFCRLPHSGQIPGHRFSVADLIVYVGEPEAIDFGDFEIVAKVTKSTVERCHMDNVPLHLQV